MALILVSVFYFVWFYQTLSLNFSVRSFVYVVLMSLLIGSLTQITKHILWKISLALILAMISIYQLINYAYIKFFKTLAPHELASGGDIETYLSTIKEFYPSIPMSIYIATLLFFIINVFIIFKFTNKKSCGTYFCGQEIEKRKNNFSIAQSFIGIFLCTLVISGGTLTTRYYNDNPREGWWENNYFVSDYGVYGNIFKGINNIFEENVQEIETAHAFEELIYENVDVEPTTEEKKSVSEKEESNLETPFDYINTYYDALRHDDGFRVEQRSVPVLSAKPNIIVYQLESVSSWAINHTPSPMPHFKELIKGNMNVGRFFANACHTIDAEYATLCSALPDTKSPIPDIGSENDYDCLPSILKDNFEYDTAVFHSNTSKFWNRDVLDPKWGFENLFFLPHYPSFKYDDLRVVEDAISYIASSISPVFAQIIGVTSHTPHNQLDLEHVAKISNLKPTFFTEDIDQDILEYSTLKEEEMRYYFSYLMMVDNAIEGLFRELERHNLIDNTIVVISNDHRLYGFKQENKIDNFYGYNQLPFMMYIPGMESVTMKDIATHMDIAPTLLNILEGESYERPEHFVGHSLFSEDHPNYAISVCHNQINFVTPNHVIVGNSEHEKYLRLHAEENMSQRQIDNIGRTLQTLVNMNGGMIRQNNIHKVY
ncbi:LTA synthase family protein [Candidatus Parcubacteria bacterium]|nr:LTA synthase family protein [Candidatus Parcubacteria bacterium]